MNDLEIDKALADIGRTLRALVAQQRAKLICCDEDYDAACARRRIIPAVRKTFHLLTKEVDDVDRRRTKNWQVKKPRTPLKRSTPKLLPQLRKGSGRFTQRILFERV